MAVSVHVLDHRFRETENALGSFLIDEGNELVLIESGPASTFSNLKLAIEDLGFEISQIKHVFLSHIHLDHAGGAWKFAKLGAEIYVHQLGYDHMLDPSRLMASAKQIYKEQMEILWGAMKPIPQEQLHAVAHGDLITVGKLNFEAIYTPGHAKHHVSWKVDDAIFTGDIAGAKVNEGPVVPPCPPPDIDVEGWLKSLEELGKHTEVRRYFLTHFGEVTQLEKHRKELAETLVSYALFIKPLYFNGISIPDAIEMFVEFVNQKLVQMGLSQKDLAAYEAANPPEMSVSGLYRYWKKKKSNR